MNPVYAKPVYFLIALFAVLGSAPLHADAGRVDQMSGLVTVERGGKNLALAQGAAVRSGDVFTTGDSGTLRVRMVNGEEIQLRPNTKFSIDQFKAPTDVANPGTGRSFYSLLKGGFRAVTRSLGKRGLNSYRISTPVATIGIRGSTIIGAFDTVNGLGMGVEEGAGFVTNAAGTVDVQAGGFASVSASAAAPVASSTMPAALSNTGFGTAGAGGSAGSAAGAVGGSMGAGTIAAIAGGAIIGAVIGVVVSGGDQSNSSTTTTTAP